MQREQKKLRVLQVVNVRWFNATAWYGLNLARLLRKAGHESLVLALPHTRAFAAAQDMGLSPLPFDFNSANPLTLARSLARAAGLLQEFRPHIVDCHRGEGLIFWGGLKKFFPFALARTRGDQRPPRGNFFNRFLHGRLLDALIATNSRTLVQCRTILKIPDERLHLLPGGVDRERFFPNPSAKAQVRRTFGFTPEDLVIGLLGRFDPVKGHRELLEAVSGLRREQTGRGAISRVRLLFIGRPAALSADDVKALAVSLGLDEVTALACDVQDAPAHINAFDLGVIASQGSEAIARAALEIMACAVPLIGTDTGVMPDLLDKEALAPTGDAAALSALLARAIADAGWREALRLEQSRRLPSLSDEAFLADTLRIYRAVLRGGNSDQYQLPPDL
ncbi:MAG: glycosyltransferase [Desulfovibrio sp.]|nr:glycosyltransferase [Desulfovibrio sp.]